MKRLLAASLLLLSACDLRPVNPPNEATAQLQNPRTGETEYCKADWWGHDTVHLDECIDQHRRDGFVLTQKNY